MILVNVRGWQGGIRELAEQKQSIILNGSSQEK